MLNFLIKSSTRICMLMVLMYVGAVFSSHVVDRSLRPMQNLADERPVQSSNLRLAGLSKSMILNQNSGLMRAQLDKISALRSIRDIKLLSFVMYGVFLFLGFRFALFIYNKVRWEFVEHPEDVETENFRGRFRDQKVHEPEDRTRFQYKSSYERETADHSPTPQPLNRQLRRHLKVFGFCHLPERTELRHTYRTLAKEWQPDRFTSTDYSEQQRANAAHMMMRINNSYEWLDGYIT